MTACSPQTVEKVGQPQANYIFITIIKLKSYLNKR